MLSMVLVPHHSMSRPQSLEVVVILHYPTKYILWSSLGFFLTQLTTTVLLPLITSPPVAALWEVLLLCHCVSYKANII